MSEETSSITKLCELMESLKTQIEIVDNELCYSDHRNKPDFREKLSAKSDKIELVKSNLDRLLLKVTDATVRRPKGRECTSTNDDSAYHSTSSERRHALYVEENDLPATAQHCTKCLQQIKSAVQVSELPIRISKEEMIRENNDI
ncbi:uncharacterized protein LOC132547163 [Ylistrum balloti]|uniref:uncharacterized protein LOC132547163 n=1 Tax=Ylistrum balloti TaxID=509963 RepID=UPI0029059ADA|nr:uncharacterized protein LOC132547163 [Ylistrum balloti]